MALQTIRSLFKRPLSSSFQVLSDLHLEINQQNSRLYSGVTILGCTLWSPNPQESTDIVHSKISDFLKIKEWSVEQHNKAHDSDLTWLRGEIQTLRETQEKRSVLVVTHHVPSLQRTLSLQHAKIL
ncbi:hypothetical protein N7465_009226 [Penicillium sp. CMV-2018d]|nr:hypothetical protein N7465_009226 [Penicillium sp. CMV-2018d]